MDGSWIFAQAAAPLGRVLENVDSSAVQTGVQTAADTAPKPPPAVHLLTAQEQLNEWYTGALNAVTTNGLQFLIRVAAAIAIFYFGRILARMATKIGSEVMEKVGTDPILVRFGANLIYCSLLVMIGIASLNMVAPLRTSSRKSKSKTPSLGMHWPALSSFATVR